MRRWHFLQAKSCVASVLSWGPGITGYSSCTYRRSQCIFLEKFCLLARRRCCSSIPCPRGMVACKLLPSSCHHFFMFAHAKIPVPFRKRLLKEILCRMSAPRSVSTVSLRGPAREFPSVTRTSRALEFPSLTIRSRGHAVQCLSADYPRTRAM